MATLLLDNLLPERRTPAPGLDAKLGSGLTEGLGGRIRRDDTPSHHARQSLTAGRSGARKLGWSLSVIEYSAPRGRALIAKPPNPYPFFDDNRQYLNQMYTTSVTIPVPLRGFGAVAAVFPTNLGLYAKAGVYTIYSDDVEFTGTASSTSRNTSGILSLAGAGWPGRERLSRAADPWTPTMSP